MEKLKIIKNSSFLLSSKIIQFVVGLLKVKISALFIGTLGVGVYNQLSRFTSEISNTLLLGMNGAIIKQIAETNDEQQQKEIVKDALKIYVTLIILVIFASTITLFIFHDFFVNFFFGDEGYKKYFIMGMLSVPILLMDSIPSALLQAFKAMKHIAFARIINIIFSIIYFIPLIMLFGIDGAVIYFPLTYVTGLIINYYYAKKYYLNRLSITIIDILKAKFNKTILTENLSFALVGLFSGSAAVFSDLSCRAIIVNDLGLEKLGLYTPNIAWAGLFTSFILPSLRTYLYPRFCEVSNQKIMLNLILNDSIRISTYLFLPLLFLVVPLRTQLIPIFYSTEFVDAAIYMPYHFLGMLIRVWWYQIMLVFTPTGKIKLHGFLMILFSLLDLVIVYLTVPKYGLWGWTLKFLISPIVFLIIYYSIIWKSLTFKLSKDNIYLIIITLFGTIMIILISIYLKSWCFELFVGVLFLIITYFMMDKNEKMKILEVIRKTIRKEK